MHFIDMLLCFWASVASVVSKNRTGWIHHQWTICIWVHFYNFLTFKKTFVPLIQIIIAFFPLYILFVFFLSYSSMKMEVEIQYIVWWWLNKEWITMFLSLIITCILLLLRKLPMTLSTQLPTICYKLCNCEYSLRAILKIFIKNFVSF